MGKHRASIEQEKEPATDSASYKKRKTRHWGSKLWGWSQFGEKKLWDWLQLLSALAIPVVLAGAGFWISAQQDIRQQAVEEQRAQDAALQAYLDQMGALILEENLRDSEEDSEARALARARTLTVLGRLDPKRKRSVVQFLYESSLIAKTDPIVDLSNADLRYIDLHLKDLRNADLSEADLREADLTNADLTGANLTNARLEDTDLTFAKLKGATLSNADLTEANLSHAGLNHADLTIATLKRTNLRGAILHEADLNYANLWEADMRYADLRDAQGVSEETLRARYVKLEGTYLPDGSKHN
jgi:uncharacterized protein YjbI with pentapeptide repeats